jgi:hypothetical protein
MNSKEGVGKDGLKGERWRRRRRRRRRKMKRALVLGSSPVQFSVRRTYIDFRFLFSPVKQAT